MDFRFQTESHNKHISCWVGLNLNNEIRSADHTRTPKTRIEKSKHSFKRPPEIFILKEFKRRIPGSCSSKKVFFSKLGDFGKSGGISKFNLPKAPSDLLKNLDLLKPHLPGIIVNFRVCANCFESVLCDLFANCT